MVQRAAGRWRRVSVRMMAAALVAAAVTACGSSTTTSGSPSGSSSSGSKQAFELKFGNIMPLTGDLSSFGASLDAAARLGAQAVNAALAQDHLNSKFSVKIVDTEDDQSAVPPAVEAAQKLLSESVNVIIGTLSSGSTIAVAQSVSIPNNIVQITPTSSSPAITALKDNNLVFQMGPNDNFQARALVAYISKELGSHALLNVGWRNDEYGNGVSTLFRTLWKAQGGQIGATVSWNPDSPSFDSAAQALVAGNPDAYMIFDFPQTFEKVGPALVRTGKWSPSKSFVSTEFSDPTALAPIGQQATAGLRGVAPAIGTTSLQNTFTAYFKQNAPGKAVTGYESFAFDAIVLASLASLQAHSPSGPTFAKDIEAISNPPGKVYNYQQLPAAIKAIEAGQKIEYDAVSGALDLSPQGAPTAADYEFWVYKNHQIKVLSTQTIR